MVLFPLNQACGRPSDAKVELSLDCLPHPYGRYRFSLIIDRLFKYALPKTPIYGEAGYERLPKRSSQTVLPLYDGGATTIYVALLPKFVWFL